MSRKDSGDNSGFFSSIIDIICAILEAIWIFGD